MKKMLGSVFGVVIFAGLLAPVLAASPASAATFFQVESFSNTHCLDEIANSSHTLALTSCEGAANEEWSITSLSNGAVRFQNESTGACLAERPGTGVVVTGCNPSSAEQQWIFEAGQLDGISVVQFESVAVQAGCLNQTGFQVDIVTCSTSSASQAWLQGP